MTTQRTLIDLVRLKLSWLGGSTGGQPVTIPELFTKLERPVRVAVVRLDGLGDWVLTLPLVLSLRDSPCVDSVTLVAPEAHRGLLGRTAGVNFIGYAGGTILDPPWPGSTLGKVRAVSALGQRSAFRNAKALAGNFDMVVLPRWDSDLGLNSRAWAAGSSAYIAGHDPSAVPWTSHGERGEAAVLHTAVMDLDAAGHEIDHLTKLMSALEIDSRVNAGYGRDFFPLIEASNTTGYIAVHASANEAKRRWPTASWRDFISSLLEVYSGDVAVVGARSDVHRNGEIIAGFGERVTNVAGKVPLATLPQFLADADAFVGNDSGPMHIASSLGLPTVAISAHPKSGDPTHRNSPTRFGPWGASSKVLQPVEAIPPCSDSCSSSQSHCIAGVHPDAVLSALLEVFRPKN